VSALPTSTGTHGKQTEPSPNATTTADNDPGGRSETRATAPVTEVAPPALPTPTPSPPRRRLWLRSPFTRRQGASSPLASPVPLTSQPLRLEDYPGDSQKQNALPPSTQHDHLQVTVLIAMPDPRRPHSDGMVFPGHTKGKERSLDLDYDEDDLPDMVLGVTELHYKDAIATPRTP
jgi:hypothetical protein